MAIFNSSLNIQVDAYDSGSQASIQSLAFNIATTVCWEPVWDFPSSQGKLQEVTSQLVHCLRKFWASFLAMVKETELTYLFHTGIVPISLGQYFPKQPSSLILPLLQPSICLGKITKYDFVPQIIWESLLFVNDHILANTQVDFCSMQHKGICWAKPTPFLTLFLSSHMQQPFP